MTIAEGYIQGGDVTGSTANPRNFTGLNYSGESIKGAAQGSMLAGDQMNTFYWLKRAIIESRKDQYFTQLASTIDMPKHYGKKMKCYVYVPLLEDRNQNSQGINAAGQTIQNGNLYGSSRDIGAITEALPLVGETGGRVNRVGFTRLMREGSFVKMGFFYEMTKEFLDFDSDAELKSHLSREMMNAAVQMSEAILQIDILLAAEVSYVAAGAEKNAGDTAVTGAEVTFSQLKTLVRALKENRTPKQTRYISGSRLIDTKTVGEGYVAYCGPDLIPTLERMVDYHGNPAWIPVEKYAAAGRVLRGEVGSVAGLKIIEVPEMLHWAAGGAKASSTDAQKFRTSKDKDQNTRFDVYPLVVVGDDSFSTIGFQTDGSSGKFSIITKMPGRDMADLQDPYGETGFCSMKWFYGFICKRPERIAVLKTVATFE